MDGKSSTEMKLSDVKSEIFSSSRSWCTNCPSLVFNNTIVNIHKAYPPTTPIWAKYQYLWHPTYGVNIIFPSSPINIKEKMV
jgi:hypothetical protein